MIGMLVVGLVGCGGVDWRHPHAIAVDDVIWPQAEDRRVFVGLMAYYDQTFPGWTTGPLWADGGLRIGRTWCSPEIPKEHCVGSALYHQSHPGDVVPPEGDAADPDLASAGSWIWLSATLSDVDNKEAGGLMVMALQKSSAGTPAIWTEYFAPEPRRAVLGSVSFGWRMINRSTEFGLSIPYEVTPKLTSSAGHAMGGTFPEELRDVLTSFEVFQAIMVENDGARHDRQMKAIAEDSSRTADDKVTMLSDLEGKLLANQLILRDNGRSMWGDLQRFLPPAVVLAPP